MSADCAHVHYGFNCAGRVIAQGRLHGRCPTCGALEHQPCQIHDDELPPVIGEAMRDTTHDIYRRALCGPED